MNSECSDNKNYLHERMVIVFRDFHCLIQYIYPMKTILSSLLFLVISASSIAQKTTIAFGSCARQSDPLTIFDTILKHHPTHFIFLGDNIYGDTRDTTVLKEKYDLLAQHTGFQHLMDSTIVWATWDDHDFGENDAGKTFPMKAGSKEIFLDFFHEPESSERRTHEGIYISHLIQDSGLTIQVIMLDTRTFRDDLLPYEGALKKDSAYQYELNYRPSYSKQATLLGKDQWIWLEKELKKEADIRILCSSIQLGHSYNGYESWTNFPKELKRFEKLMKSTKSNGLFVISGDVHYGELSEFRNKITYPIYDLTSSGLSANWERATPNTHRIAGPIMENNFGLIRFEKTASDCNIRLQLFDLNDQVVLEKALLLSQLRF